MPQISVIVCTRNRSRLLVDTLHSLRMQGLSPAEREIVVVDNGSNDDTAEAVTKLALQMQPLRYVLEPHVGVSRARNAGVRASRAPIVAFIDDDVIPAEDWLKRLLEAFAENPQAWAVGGRAYLVWPNGEPRWVSPSFRSLFAHFDLGDEPKHVRFPQTLFGLNLAFRREAFDVLGGFSPALGRVGHSLISGEEGEMCSRIEAAGKTLLYDPRIVVYHHVLPERLHKRWLIRRAFAQGRTFAVRSLSREAYTSRREWVMFAGRSLEAMVRGNVQVIKKLLTGRATSADLMERVVRVSMSIGRAVEALRIAATNRKWTSGADIRASHRASKAESA